MLIQRAVLLDGTAVDIRVGPKIVDVADRLVPRPGEDVYDAAGGTVLPGLHDHHLHIRAAAAAMTSVHVGPEVVQVVPGDADGECRTSWGTRVTLRAPRLGATGYRVLADLPAATQEELLQLMEPDEAESTGSPCRTIPRPPQCVHVEEKASISPVPSFLLVSRTRPSDVTSDTW